MPDKTRFDGFRGPPIFLGRNGGSNISGDSFKVTCHGLFLDVNVLFILKTISGIPKRNRVVRYSRIGYVICCKNNNFNIAILIMFVTIVIKDKVTKIFFSFFQNVIIVIESFFNMAFTTIKLQKTILFIVGHFYNFIRQYWSLRVVLAWERVPLWHLTVI